MRSSSGERAPDAGDDDALKVGISKTQIEDGNGGLGNGGLSCCDMESFHGRRLASLLARRLAAGFRAAVEAGPAAGAATAAAAGEGGRTPFRSCNEFTIGMHLPEQQQHQHQQQQQQQEDGRQVRTRLRAALERWRRSDEGGGGGDAGGTRFRSCNEFTIGTHLSDQEELEAAKKRRD